MHSVSEKQICLVIVFVQGLLYPKDSTMYLLIKVCRILGVTDHAVAQKHASK